MTTTKYLWDSENDSYLMETDGDDVLTAAYTAEPLPYGRVISQQIASETRWYHFDVIGSTREVTDASTSVIETLGYDAWGMPLSSTTLASTFKWLGEFGYTDDSTPIHPLTYVRRRHYRSLIGRWNSCDPAASSINLCAYVANTPILLIDPSGLSREPGAGLYSKTPFRPSDNEWHFTYTSDPAKLKDGKVGYRWSLKQTFQDGRTLPAAWGGVTPEQTWQVNMLSHKFFIGDGTTCSTPEPTLRFIGDVTGPPIKFPITDDLELKNATTLPPTQEVCLLHEVVNKQLGFNANGILSRRGSGREMSEAEATAGATKMRGPFLYMQTQYIFLNAPLMGCDSKCRPCHDQIRNELSLLASGGFQLNELRIGVPSIDFRLPPGVSRLPSGGSGDFTQYTGNATVYEQYTVLAARDDKLTSTPALQFIDSWRHVYSYF